MLRTLVLLIAFLLAGCASIDLAALDPRVLFDTRPKQPETELDRLVNQFSATAFDSQYGPRRNRFHRIDANVVIRVVEPSFGQRGKIIAAASELAQLANHPIAILEPDDLTTPANLVVTFNANNICKVGTRAPNEPIFVQIGASRCVAEELYQALAMDNEACIVATILCPGSKGAAYTEADKILIRVAYDARLKLGMNRKEALPIAREIIGETMSE